jgi:hypothetical protein
MAQPPIVVIFDESISPRIASAIAGFCAGHDTRFRFDVMLPGTKDRDWLSGYFPADPPHVVIAKDSVLRPKAQTLLWLKGGLTVVVVDGRIGNITLEHLAGTLLRWWPAISATIHSNPRQGAFVVPSRYAERDRLPKWIRNPRKHRKPRLAQGRPPKKKMKVGRLDRRQAKFTFDR